MYYDTLSLMMDVRVIPEKMIDMFHWLSTNSITYFQFAWYESGGGPHRCIRHGLRFEIAGGTEKERVRNICGDERECQKNHGPRNGNARARCEGICNCDV